MHKRVLSLSKQAVQNQFKNTARCYASLPSEASAVTYSKYGDPTEVLKVEKVKLPEKLQPNQVLVQMQAAPINPADFNMIEGTYGRNPKLPAIVGNEGAGVVQAVGDQVTDLKVGDRVIPSKPSFGTWRTYAVAGSDELLKVSSDIPLEYAATIGVNPSTAYRMLNDFASLKAGDVVVQNGATSMVGHAVVQIAKARGIKTINIVRDRPGNEDVIERLKILGGDIVVSEKYANSAAMRNLIAELPKAKLGLNCAGGPAARTVANLLGEGASLVTYGGMSRQPISISTGSLIFKDLTLRGFWVSRWIEQNSKEDRLKMINELSDLIKSKKLVLMMKSHKFSDFNVALKEALDPAPTKRSKIVLELQK